MEKEIHSWCNRSFQDLESHFGSGMIRETIEEKLSFQNEVNLLEIGYGNGRTLLEIKKMFSTERLKLYGINYNSTNESFYDQFIATDAFKEVAVANEIFTGEEFENLWLPRRFFYDAGEGLRFNRTIDVIVSQFAFPYIKQKDKLVEEMWRVLKPEGVAFVHTDVYSENYPRLLKVCGETPRFVVYKGNYVLSLREHFVKLRNEGFNITLKDSLSRKGDKVMIIRKTQDRLLRMGFKMDDLQSFDLSSLRHLNHKIWWGQRSVYRI